MIVFEANTSDQIIGGILFFLSLCIVYATFSSKEIRSLGDAMAKHSETLRAIIQGLMGP